MGIDDKIEENWEQFYQTVIDQASIIKNTGKKFDGIYGIPRGGLIVAVCFSHILELPLITDIKEATLKTLIVDEIVETGKAFKSLNLPEPIENYTTVALCKYKDCPFNPTHWLWLTNRYVKFPWEIK